MYLFIKLDNINCIFIIYFIYLEYWCSHIWYTLDICELELEYLNSI